MLGVAGRTLSRRHGDRLGDAWRSFPDPSNWTQSASIATESRERGFGGVARD